MKYLNYMCWIFVTALFPFVVSGQEKPLTKQEVVSLQTGSQKPASWIPFETALLSCDVHQMAKSLAIADRDPNNRYLYQRHQIEVMKGLLLMVQAKALTFENLYYVRYSTPEQVGAQTTRMLRARKMLSPQLMQSLQFMLDNNLPTMATLLPTGAENACDQFSDSLIAFIYDAHGKELQENRLPLEGAPLELQTNRASLAWHLAFLMSQHPVFGIRRSPFTHQVIFDKDAYILFLTGTLIEASNAGLATPEGPLVQRALATACNHLKRRPPAEQPQLITICALVEPTLPKNKSPKRKAKTL